MDLAKIIGELKMQLQYVDAAIASMEELARAQALAEAAARNAGTPEAGAIHEFPDMAGAAPVKRRRGRPRKNAGAEPVAQSVSASTVLAPAETPEPEAAHSKTDSTASAA